MCYFSWSFIRYFVLALQGTFVACPILKAQQLDKLPKEQRDLEIHLKRTKKQAILGTTSVCVDEVNLSTSNVCLSPFLHPTASAISHDNLGLSPQDTNPRREWILNRESQYSIRRQTEEETTSASSSLTASPWQYQFLTDRNASPGQFTGQLTDGCAERLNRGSHRRSVSAVTLWRILSSELSTMW